MAKTAAPAPTKGAGRVIDLDEARAARAEATGDPVTMRFGGRDFALSPELPLDFAIHAKNGEMRQAVEALLDPDDVEAFFALRPSIEDFKAIADHISTVYGLSAGDS